MSLLTLFGGCILQPLNNTGGIVPGGKLTFYAAGTVTLKNTYTDAAKTTLATNPVVLDGNGRAAIFLNNDAAYDIVFKSADGGTTFWTLLSVIANKPVV